MNEVRYSVLEFVIIFLLKLREIIDFLHFYPLVTIDLLFFILLLIYTIKSRSILVTQIVFFLYKYKVSQSNLC